MTAATRGLLLSTALLCGSITPAVASRHTPAECREGGEFIRNATISRDNGLPRDAFFNHLIADLSMIRSLPEDLRWFARDEADEALLLRHAERVYDFTLAPKDNEAAFIADCGKAGGNNLSQRTR